MSDGLSQLGAALMDRYRLDRELGQGGMATVYLAQDLRHDRPVALKVLRPELAAIIGAGRFLAEIKTTANLQHPHILPLFDSGQAGGRTGLPEFVYYVMPFVEGDSLRDRLTRDKQLPIDEAVRITREVADALSAAHAAGVIHRDIKPENILLQGGHALVADFGIALAASRADGTGRLTETGMSLGTPHYMSPEQALGERNLDARTDVYALGCVLYEMLVGEPPFTGASAQAILAKVMNERPQAPSVTRDTVPPGVEAAVLTALAKLPVDRFPSAAAFSDALSKPNVAPVFSRTQRRAVPAAAITAALLAAGVTGWLLHRPAPAASEPLRLTVVVPAGVTLPMETGHPVLALSPDGSTLVFVGDDRGVRRLYRRALAERDAQPIPGTEGAAAPFFSPDGGSIGFIAGPLVKRVSTAGGLPVPVSIVTPVMVNRGATWLTSDSLLASLSPNSGLSTQALTAGSIPGITDWRPITDATMSYSWPRTISGTPYVVFAENEGGASDQARLSLLNRRTGTVLPLLSGGTSPLAESENRLLFVRGGSLYAVDLNAGRGLVGPEQRLLDQVMTEPEGAAHVALSRSGIMAYVAGQSVSRERELVWVDRQGVASVIPVQARDWQWPRLSPDGQTLAITASLGTNTDLYTLALGRMTIDRLTVHPGEDFGAVWSPDGTRLAFSSEQFSGWAGPRGMLLAATGGNLHMLLAADSTPEKTPKGNWTFPTSWSSDGQWIAYESVRDGNADVNVARADRAEPPRPFAAQANAQERGAAFSPDGRFIAYVASDESGVDEVYVQPFPGPGPRIRISTQGGVEPLWNPRGLELFYRHGDDLMSVQFDDGSTLRPRAPTVLFTGHFDPAPYGGEHAHYSVSPDGTRFIFVRRSNVPRPAEIQIVTNWPSALGLESPLGKGQR